MSARRQREPAPEKKKKMAIKSDRWIRMMAQEYDMINPFADRQQATGMISYGLSSYGYDLRVSDEFKIFTNVNNAIVDPKDFREESFVTKRTDVAIIEQVLGKKAAAIDTDVMKWFATQPH